MNIQRTSPPRTDAGTFPGGPSASGALSTTHEPGEGDLTAARAIMAQVSDFDDLQIARACHVVLNSPQATDSERRDAVAMIALLPMIAVASGLSAA